MSYSLRLILVNQC